jgi:hypothetical protein
LLGTDRACRQLLSTKEFKRTFQTAQQNGFFFVSEATCVSEGPCARIFFATRNNLNLNLKLGYQPSDPNEANAWWHKFSKKSRTTVPRVQSTCMKTNPARRRSPESSGQRRGGTSGGISCRTRGGSSDKIQISSLLPLLFFQLDSQLQSRPPG